MRKLEEGKIKRRLSRDEAAALRAETTAILIPTDVHQAHSSTYGGRNTPGQIAADATNLRAAAERDLTALRPRLIETGLDEDNIEQAARNVHARNKELGYYDD